MIKKPWVIFVIIALLVVLPFPFFGEALESYITQLVQHPESSGPTLAVIMAGALAGDVFLPIPSNIVSISAGYVFGAIYGCAISALGMTLGVIFGYASGALGGHVLDEKTQQRMHQLIEHYGLAMVIMCRGIPILAEASVIFCGAARLDMKRFFVVATIANLLVSAIYATAGAMVDSEKSLGLAFVFSVFIPAGCWGVYWLIHHVFRPSANQDS